MYKNLIRPIFFLFDPERIHGLVFSTIRFANKIRFIRKITHNTFSLHDKGLEKEVFGIRFPNPVGLAAGFDKDATAVDALSMFGFGFIEIGTLTPLPQSGNPKKRLFRLKKDQGLINRMGFNNAGTKAAVERLNKRKNRIIIGGNIGKNKITPNEKALQDYLTAFEHLFDQVDYFVVNVSSPNTPGLRELQQKKPLLKLLNALQLANQKKPQSKPILLKIAPDLNEDQLRDIIDIIIQTGISGVIATNTTLSREGLLESPEKITRIGEGGLSGKPLRQRSTEIIRFLAHESGKAFPIIGAGGIHSPEDALEKLEAGADLIQIYTGFIYEGPGLVKRILQHLLKQTS